MSRAKIEIEDMITVGDLADKLMIPTTKLITELMKNGIMMTVNERVDFDTAQIITGELNLPDIELVRTKDKESAINVKKSVTVSESAEARPPVVAVMGHVDHGKTTLLDAIRGVSVAKQEAGGITQHISAYQVDHKGKKITFLDTPGHEAFASLREHGAQLTDLAVIVIAADDGIKPQTLEAIRFAQKSGVKMIFALNKIDKPDINIDRIKQQLAEQNLMPEDWGGDTIIVPVSAKSKEGVDKLIEMITLVAEVEELKADVNVPASGLIIESHMEKGLGSVVIALVQAGTLKSGQYMVVGSIYGKVRSLESTGGNIIDSAGPSTPVRLTGFKSLPEFGQEFSVVACEKDAKKIIEELQRNTKGNGKSGVSTSSQLLRMINRNIEVSELRVIIKADVQGSLTSVLDFIKTLDTEEVSITVVGSSVGNINDNDLQRAVACGAIIYGFNVELPRGLRQVVTRDKIRVRLYKVIYELIDDVKNELTGLLSPEVIQTDMGSLKVKAVFKTTKTDVIAGGEVIKGKLVIPALANILRDGKTVNQEEILVAGLKRGPTEVREIQEGNMCGIQLKTSSKLDVYEGDIIEVYTKQEVARTL
jgi:translation initiation factor IF-2